MTTHVAPGAAPAVAPARGRRTHLFSPVTFRSVTAKNRVMVSPMCQYSAPGGIANAWHSAHLAARAVGGAGIVCIEATHVERRGQITPWCLGIWTDEQRDALVPIVRFMEDQGAVPMIQLAHAGRKGSSRRPWEGGGPLPEGDPAAWTPIAPSAIPHDEGWRVPIEMDTGMIAEVQAAFAAAARRSREAGFRILEFHAAHGYLTHSFLSPVSNHRTDGYGGSLTNRARFLMEALDAVRAEWPEELPLFVRLSCTDWVPGGLTIEDTVEVSRMLKARGDVDLVDCSSGGVHPKQEIALRPGYQVPFAARIRREAQIATGAVGLIKEPDHAEAILADGSADLVILGRILLANPYWPLHAARALKAEVDWPRQYERAAPLL